MFLRVGDVIERSGDTWVVAQRHQAYPIYVLAPVHWNEQKQAWIGDESNRQAVSIEQEIEVIGQVPKKRLTTVVRPSENYQHYAHNGKRPDKTFVEQVLSFEKRCREKNEAFICWRDFYNPHLNAWLEDVWFPSQMPKPDTHVFTASCQCEYRALFLKGEIS